MKNIVRKTKGRPEEIDIEVGQNIRAARNAIRMSQERLAASVGLTFQQIQKYERGLNRVAPSRLCKIADALECPVISFFPAQYQGGKKGLHESLIEKNAALEAKIRSMIEAGTGKEYRGRV
jgi:transcriptional regulator with XRE-family HTH domain